MVYAFTAVDVATGVSEEVCKAVRTCDTVYCDFFPGRPRAVLRSLR
ncbi:hypothetical protein [Natrarchaeobius halalkaliphilus]|nr:hypothetical protein [Natrarchaeobius halalkaliphilus]